MSPHLRGLQQTALATMLGQWSEDAFWGPAAPATVQEAEIVPSHSGFAGVDTIRSRRSGETEETAEAERLAI